MKINSKTQKRKHTIYKTNGLETLVPKKKTQSAVIYKKYVVYQTEESTTQKQVANAIKPMKNKIRTGPETISAELLKYGRPKLTNMITQLFNQYIADAEITSRKNLKQQQGFLQITLNHVDPIKIIKKIYCL